MLGKTSQNNQNYHDHVQWACKLSVIYISVSMTETKLVTTWDQLTPSKLLWWIKMSNNAVIILQLPQSRGCGTLSLKVMRKKKWEWTQCSAPPLSKLSYGAWLTCRTTEAIDRYRQAMQNTTGAVAEAKTRMW